MQQTAPTRFERRRQQTHGRLLEAARALFAEQGLHDTAISAIAERADVGLGTFYLHFAGKDEVLEAIVDDDLSTLLARIAEATMGVESATECHHIGTRIYLEYAYTNRAFFRILFEQVPQAHDVLRAARERWVEATLQLLRAGLAGGEIHTDNPELIARSMVAIVGQASLWWSDHDGPAPAELATTVSAFIEHGLKGQAS